VFFKTGSIGERILVRELVDQITRVAPQAEVGVVVGGLSTEPERRRRRSRSPFSSSSKSLLYRGREAELRVCSGMLAGRRALLLLLPGMTLNGILAVDGTDSEQSP